MKTPVLSVVMSVYNGGEYLREAVESILRQTFSDFEFVIIDDGSTDKSQDILKEYAKKDKRINLIKQKNGGMSAALNRGVKVAKGFYIARQDADDISASERLEKQLDFMRDNPETTIVGSSISVMDDKSRILHQHAVLLNDPELRQELLVRSPFAHGAVMFKKSDAIKAGLYDQAAWPVEDYDFWLRLSKYGHLANLDEYLYIYREHSQSMTGTNSKLMAEKPAVIQAKAWRERSRLLPKRRIELGAYKNLDMGQQRIERIIDNNVFISKAAWQHNQKTLALKNMSLLAGDKITYRKAAGKLKRKLGK